MDYFSITTWALSVSLLISCSVLSPTLCKEKVRTQKVASSMVSSRVTWVMPYVSVPRLGQYWSHLIWICKTWMTIGLWIWNKVTVQVPVNLPRVTNTWIHLKHLNQKYETLPVPSLPTLGWKDSVQNNVEWSEWQTSGRIGQFLCVLGSNHLQSHIALQDREVYTLKHS